MRKKSHIELSRFLATNVPSEILDCHRKAFIIGSVLPDCKPSFITTKHNIDETFDLLSKFISDCTVKSSEEFRRISTDYCVKLGEITHYIADYFTYPHNSIYLGNLKDHCLYEKYLKTSLKEYVRGNSVVVDKEAVLKLETPSMILDYIKSKHELYLKEEKSLKNDCSFIVSICYVVVVAVLNICQSLLLNHSSKLCIQ